MSKVAIVTDSTVNLPENFIHQFGIHVAPQVLIWDGETFEDGVDVHPNEYFERLKNSKTMPSTSQVTPTSFLNIFGKLIEEDYQILAILIAEKLSGTISSAIQAKEAFPGAPIEIVDFEYSFSGDGFHRAASSRGDPTGGRLSRKHAIWQTMRAGMSVCSLRSTHLSSCTTADESAERAVLWRLH